MNEEALFFFYKDLAWGQLLLYLVVWSGMKKIFPVGQQNLCAFPKNSKQERISVDEANYVFECYSNDANLKDFLSGSAYIERSRRVR